MEYHRANRGLPTTISVAMKPAARRGVVLSTDGLNLAGSYVGKHKTTAEPKKGSRNFFPLIFFLGFLLMIWRATTALSEAKTRNSDIESLLNQTAARCEGAEKKAADWLLKEKVEIGAIIDEIKETVFNETDNQESDGVVRAVESMLNICGKTIVTEVGGLRKELEEKIGATESELKQFAARIEGLEKGIKSVDWLSNLKKVVEIRANGRDNDSKFGDLRKVLGDTIESLERKLHQLKVGTSYLNVRLQFIQPLLNSFMK